MADEMKPGHPAGDEFASLIREAQPEGAPGSDTGGAPGGDPAAADPRGSVNVFDMIKAFPLTRKKFPHFHAAMTEAEMKESAEALGAVFDKYGWSLSGLFDKYAIELKAVMVFGSWTYALSGALLVDIEAIKQRKAAAKAKADSQAAADGSK
jgi:hypothetical protein